MSRVKLRGEEMKKGVYFDTTHLLERRLRREKRGETGEKTFFPFLSSLMGVRMLIGQMHCLV
jgi:hypothetical protein